MSDAEARAISATLNREGIAVSTEREGYTDPIFQVAVTPSAVPRAVAALRASEPIRAPAPAEALALIPTRDQERAAEERGLQERLQRALLELPGVRSAAVQVQLGAESNALSDLLHPGKRSDAKADIALTRDGRSTVDREHVRQLAAHMVPGLSVSAVQLSDQAEAGSCTPCAELSHLGEVTLTSTSLSTLKLWLGASLLAHMLSAIALLVLLQRRRTTAPHKPPKGI